jgi:ATP-binding cassette subfamily F protein 3
VNGAGKTTQLQIITGSILPDDGEILKQKANMKIAYLTQEFDVEPTRTVRVSLGSFTHSSKASSCGTTA